jgi:hypothetical protein
MFFTSNIAGNKTVSKTQMLQVTFTMQLTVEFRLAMNIINRETVYGRVANISSKIIKFLFDSDKYK